jgi:drug/metabolite transporter (DMT)-like permease
MTQLRAVALMIFAVSAFSVMDGIGKLLSADYDVVEIIWGRYAFALPVLVMVAGPRRWPGLLRGSRPGLQILRGLLPLAAGGFIVLALRTVPLADATAITFVAPLLVTALSIPLLGETVGWHRWSAVVIGFAGVVVIARPGAGAFQWAALLPLGTALLFALYQIATKILSAAVSPRATLIFTMLVGFAASTVMLPLAWQAPSAGAWALMALSGLCNGLGHYALIRSYEGAAASTLAPFVYAQIVGAAVFGYFVFADTPDAMTFLGAAIIAGSGLYIVQRERKLAARTAAERPASAGPRRKR